MLTTGSDLRGVPIPQGDGSDVPRSKSHLFFSVSFCYHAICYRMYLVSVAINSFAFNWLPLRFFRPGSFS